MIDKDIELSLVCQCELLDIHRSGLYYTPVPEKEENLQLIRLMDAQYLSTPFYGVRRVTEWLKAQGYNVNRKRVRRLMQVMRWKTIYRKPNLSKPEKGHKIYPYLLKGLNIERANQVWAIDITYIPMKKGFMYLCAIIDHKSRYVVNWSLSNTMTAEWCRSVVEEAIQKHGKPEIFNSDQGSQFTSEVFTSLLLDYDIKISMDSKGRALDNIFIERLWKSVKYECVYLHGFEDGISLYKGLDQYLSFYNKERLHQSLEYQTPEQHYLKGAA